MGCHIQKTEAPRNIHKWGSVGQPFNLETSLASTDPLPSPVNTCDIDILDYNGYFQVIRASSPAVKMVSQE
jgi:hypothetical protein